MDPVQARDRLAKTLDGLVYVDALKDKHNTAIDPRTVIYGAPNTDKAVQPVPWSRTDLLRRARTYKPSTWFCKPSNVDAIVCARHGWVNVGVDHLKCEFCRKEIWFPALQSSDTLHLQKAAERFLQQLSEGHDTSCLWRTSPTSPHLAAMPQLPAEQVYHEFEERCRQLSTLSKLPDLMEGWQERLDEPLRVRVTPLVEAGPMKPAPKLVPEREAVALAEILGGPPGDWDPAIRALALFGWEAAVLTPPREGGLAVSSKSDGEHITPVVYCSSCGAAALILDGPPLTARDSSPELTARVQAIAARAAQAAAEAAQNRAGKPVPLSNIPAASPVAAAVASVARGLPKDVHGVATPNSGPSSSGLQLQKGVASPSKRMPILRGGLEGQLSFETIAGGPLAAQEAALVAAPFGQLNSSAVPVFGRPASAPSPAQTAARVAAGSPVSAGTTAASPAVGNASPLAKGPFGTPSGPPAAAAAAADAPLFGVAALRAKSCCTASKAAAPAGVTVFGTPVDSGPPDASKVAGRMLHGGPPLTAPPAVRNRLLTLGTPVESSAAGLAARSSAAAVAASKRRREELDGGTSEAHRSSKRMFLSSTGAAVSLASSTASVKPLALHPMDHHRSFCPWVHVAAGSEAGVPGWQYVLDMLQPADGDAGAALQGPAAQSGSPAAAGPRGTEWSAARAFRAILPRLHQATRMSR